MEKQIIGIKCPCCQEEIPVRVELYGSDVSNGIIRLVELGSGDEPFPAIEVGVGLCDDIIERFPEIERETRNRLDYKGGE